MSWFTSLETSEQITLISSIATISVSTISVLIALAALNATRQSVIQANRPYVVVYLETIDIGYYVKYLVVKNYGASGAFIQKVNCNKPFADNLLNGFIDDLSNRYIAPGQSFTTVIEFKDMPSLKINEPFILTVSYSDNIGKYAETFELNTARYQNHSRLGVSKKNLNAFENEVIQALHAIKKSEF
ncbi:hypothetical protein ABIA69_001937 [Lysinibacillus parviboronicapiens]|uniref:DUF2393 domain-containing protein n=1 Tax=Lysinibacillus parviboronicapiens TaxID=436516 RepID=A0ABV2PJC5_9BACI